MPACAPSQRVTTTPHEEKYGSEAFAKKEKTGKRAKLKESYNKELRGGKQIPKRNVCIMNLITLCDMHTHECTLAEQNINGKKREKRRN